MGTLHYHPCATCGGDVPCHGDYEPPDWSGLDICETYHSPEVDSYFVCQDCQLDQSYDDDDLFFHDDFDY